MSRVSDISRVRRRGRNVGRLGVVDSTRLPLAVTGVVLLAAVVVGLTAWTSVSATMLGLGALGLVLAWGWPVLVGAPGLGGVRGVLVVGALAMAAVVGLADGRRLAAVPLVAAAVVIAGLLQQLTREGTRPRLTEGVAAVASGVALLGSGAAYLPIAALPRGPGFVVLAMSGLAVGAVVELVGRMRRVGSLAVLPVMAAGAVVGYLLAPGLGFAAAFGAGLGMLMASFSHTTRRVLGAVPGAHQGVAQLALAIASVLLPGVLVYVFGLMAKLG